MKQVFKDAAKALGLYLLVVVGGVFVLLVASAAVGYLPYSDRPGPGWHGRSFDLRQIGFFLSWAALLLPYAAVYSVFLFGFMRVLAWLRAPKSLLRVVAAVLYAYVTLNLVAGIGWYIAIAAAPVYCAAALAAVYAALLLPRYLPPNGAGKPTPIHFFGIIAVLLLGVAASYRLFIYQPYSQSLDLLIIRVVPSPATLDSSAASSGLSATDVSRLHELVPTGNIHFGSSFQSGGGSGPKARLVIVATGRILGTVRLRVPKAASAMYVQRNNEWVMVPAGAPTLRDTIALSELGDSAGAIAFAVSNDSSRHTFTWYPPLH